MIPRVSRRLAAVLLIAGMSLGGFAGDGGTAQAAKAPLLLCLSLLYGRVIYSKVDKGRCAG